MSIISDFDQKMSNQDDIYSDIMDQIAHAKETLAEAKNLTDNKKLEEKLVMQDVKVENLKQTLSLKTKQLHELNEQLKCKKADAAQCKNQRSSNFDLVAEIFKDTKKFSSRAGHEINQIFQSLGLDIEFVDLAIVKIQKDGKWFKLGMNDHSKLTLIDMNPRHSRFSEIQILFEETRDLAGLLSIFGWCLDE
ncbi:hypothetical protein HA402_013617 [Bradysia odoriphaga]|nr:hypothetical protein HA402_013617 [Bradysia odoriphaga]